MGWHVTVRHGERSESSAWQAALGGSVQYPNDDKDRMPKKILRSSFTQEQAEDIAKFLNNGFLYVDYATAERD